MASVGVKFWSWIRLNKRLKCQQGDNSTVIWLTIWRNLSWTIALVSNLTRFGIVAAFSFTMNRHSFERVPMNRNQRVRVFMAQTSHAKGETETPKFVLISLRYLLILSLDRSRSFDGAPEEVFSARQSWLIYIAASDWKLLSKTDQFTPKLGVVRIEKKALAARNEIKA